MKKALTYIIVFVLGGIASFAYSEYRHHIRELQDDVDEIRMSSIYQFLLLERYAKNCESRDYEIARDGLSTMTDTYDWYMERIDSVPFIDPSQYINMHKKHIKNNKESLVRIEEIFEKCKIY